MLICKILHYYHSFFSPFISGSFNAEFSKLSRLAAQSGESGVASDRGDARASGATNGCGDTYASGASNTHNTCESGAANTQDTHGNAHTRGAANACDIRGDACASGVVCTYMRVPSSHSRGPVASGDPCFNGLFF